MDQFKRRAAFLVLPSHPRASEQLPPPGRPSARPAAVQNPPPAGTLLTVHSRVRRDSAVPVTATGAVYSLPSLGEPDFWPVTVFSKL